LFSLFFGVDFRFIYIVPIASFCDSVQVDLLLFVVLCPFFCIALLMCKCFLLLYPILSCTSLFSFLLAFLVFFVFWRRFFLFYFFAYFFLEILIWMFSTGVSKETSAMLRPGH
jgi:hypothetical protein